MEEEDKGLPTGSKVGLPTRLRVTCRHCHGVAAASDPALGTAAEDVVDRLCPDPDDSGEEEEEKEVVVVEEDEDSNKEGKRWRRMRTSMAAWGRGERQ